MSEHHPRYHINPFYSHSLQNRLGQNPKESTHPPFREDPAQASIRDGMARPIGGPVSQPRFTLKPQAPTSLETPRGFLFYPG